jgi:PIN domain nuclease of toxin-antitoxin system
VKGLPDTHTFIWWGSDPDRLSDRARAFTLDPSNEALLSVVGVWEIVIKRALGKFHLHRPIDGIVIDQTAHGIAILRVVLEHVLAVAGLPAIHADPFDRLLIARAKVEGAAMDSGDPLIARYHVPIIW